ncbi:MAG: ATP synthase F1 subunit epsilon [Rhodospirillales bacterium]|nr:ATP synthase F1 subunit epsilon [Rhodospirillales bacterium]
MDTATTFHFELVSPERKLMSEPVTMAVIPGEEGNVGVLPNHSALVVSIRPGVVEVYDKAGDAPKRIFIAGGFADISAENCTVLAEEAVDVAALSEAELDKSIRNLTEDMGLASGDIDKARIERKLVIAKSKLSAVTGQIVL